MIDFGTNLFVIILEHELSFKIMFIVTHQT